MNSTMSTIQLESLWMSLRASVGNDAIFFATTCTLIHFVLFFGIGSVYLVATNRGWFQTYKINPNRLPDQQRISATIRHALGDNAFTLPPLMYFLVYPILSSQYTSKEAFIDPASLPTFQAFLVEIFVSIFLSDTMTYWTHRWMHENKFLYKHVHKKHHEFHVTFAFAAHHAHYSEGWIAAIANSLGPLLLRSHALTFIAWFAICVLQTVDNHGGYDFPWSPFAGHARRHDFHHSHNLGCYGNFTAFWDRVMGTDAHYLAWRQKEEKPR